MKNQMRPGFVQINSISIFYVLAFSLGTGAVILVVLGVIPSSLALVSVLSASIAGVIMTAVEDGKAGLIRMFSQLLIWRVGIGYWLFATLFLVPVVLLGSLFNPLFNGDPISWNQIEPGFGILPLFFLFFIVSGIGQELGWSGYLTPRLQVRYSALTACLIRAVLVGIWHIPLLFYARGQPTALSDFPYGGWIAQKGFLVTLLTTTLVFQLSWSVFFGWFFNNTGGSLLLVSVLHGSEIWAADWMLRAGISHSNINNYWGYGGILVLTAIWIVIRTGHQNLSRKYNRIVHKPSSG